MATPRLHPLSRRLIVARQSIRSLSIALIEAHLWKSMPATALQRHSASSFTIPVPSLPASLDLPFGRDLFSRLLAMSQQYTML